ncbi:MAG: hypothetical protein QXS41_00995 [Candidatus Woesearchaeota archaeon]
MKKSQATYFILFGIVITFFILFSSYVVFQGKKELSQNKPLVSLIESLKEDPLNSYLKKCNDYALRKTLLDFGKYAFFPNLTFNEYKVEYITSRNSEYIGREVPVLISNIDNNLIYNPPLFPLNSFNLDPSTVDLSLLNGIKKRGEVPLFYYGLPNKVLFQLSTVEKKYELVTTKIPLLLLLSVPESARQVYSLVKYPGFFVDNTIEYWFNRKAEKYFEDCLDIPTIEKLTNFDYDLKNITAKVVFQESDTVLVTHVEYLITSLTQKNQMKKSTVKSEIKFPFLQLYTDIATGLENEIKDITFNFKRYLQILARKYNLDFLSFYDSYNSAYIYVLYGKEKIISNEKFLLHFAISDRPPVLFYVGDALLLNNPLKINFKAETNSYFTVTPIAIDPDDGPVRYHYSPENLCLGKCWKSSPENLWMNSDLYNSECVDVSFYPSNVIELIGKKHRCSRVFVNTLDAYTNLSEEGSILGLNSFYVLVYDENSKLDFQKVNVLVSSKDFEFLNEKIYDISENITSTEDIFLFRLGGGILADRMFSKLNITLKNLSNSIEYNEEIPSYLVELVLPYDLSYRAIIQNAPNKPSFFNLSMLGKKILDISILDDLGNEIIKDQKEIEIKQCLPHRSYAYTYPFNKLSSNLNIDKTIPGLTKEELSNYLSNHSCCNDDGTFKSSSELCFSKSISVCGWVLNKTNSLINFLNIDTSLFSSFNVNSVTSSEKIYEIYNVNINSYCSGNRGNICNGNTQETWTLSSNFRDSSLIEQCIGCVFDGSNFILHNFTDTTFEEWLKTNQGINTYPKGICKQNIITNSILIYNNTPINGAYLYLCNLTCENGICNKPRANQCINSTQYDVCSGNILNDYYFDVSTALKNITIAFDELCKSVMQINDAGSLISLVSNHGYARSGDFCYSMQKLTCSDLENLRNQYPKLSENIIKDNLCNSKYIKVNCALYSSIDNVNYSKGFESGKAIIKKSEIGSNCKFDCKGDNCCNVASYECNSSSLGNTLRYNNKDFYCTYDAFNNSFLWVINKTFSSDPFERLYLKPKEFCLDGRDNDLDGKIDYRDEDCVYKLCIKNNKFGLVLQKSSTEYDCFTDGFVQWITTYSRNLLVYSNLSNFYLDTFTFNISNLENQLQLSYDSGFLNDVKQLRKERYDSNLSLVINLELSYNETKLFAETRKNIINIDKTLITVENEIICYNFSNNKSVQCSDGLACTKDISTYLNREHRKHDEIISVSADHSRNAYFSAVRSKFYNIYQQNDCKEIKFKNILGNLSFKYSSYEDYHEKRNILILKDTESSMIPFEVILFRYQMNHNLSLCIIYDDFIPKSIGVINDTGCVNATYIIKNETNKLIYNRRLNVVSEILATSLNVGDYTIIDINNLKDTEIYAYILQGNNLFYCDQYSFVVKNESNKFVCKNEIGESDLSKQCLSYNCRDISQCKIYQTNSEGLVFYNCERVLPSGP